MEITGSSTEAFSFFLCEARRFERNPGPVMAAHYAQALAGSSTTAREQLVLARSYPSPEILLAVSEAWGRVDATPARGVASSPEGNARPASRVVRAMASFPRLHRALWVLPLLASQIACDQATKELAVRELKGERGPSFLGGAVKLVFAENQGAFLGMGKGLSETARLGLFTVMVGLALFVGLIYLLLEDRLSVGPTAAGAVLLAGGLGNLIDRAVNEGRVVDFIQLGLGPLKTGIFNMADVQIAAAALALMWISRRQRPEPERSG